MIFENNLSPILLDLGALEIRYYGLFFALGLVLSYAFIGYVFKRESLKQDNLDSLVIYIFIGLVIGARLGHIVFYNPEYFAKNPLEILFIWHGGLASHGALIGIFLSYSIWCYVKHVKFFEHLDALILGVPIGAFFVRLGNFFNSEIVGYKTDGDFGVIFKRLGEDFPRHPAQLYEAGLLLCVFLILSFTHFKFGKNLPKGFLFGLFLFTYFGGRIYTEIYKDLHVFSADFPLSMGQMLSILPATLGLMVILALPVLQWRQGRRG